jgi:hypothetical protein
MIMKIVFWIVGILAALIAVLWAGFQVQPSGFAALPFAGQEPETTNIPAGLPAPVERFLRATYGGDRIPVLKTVVLSGRAKMKPGGPWYLPARFRFIHNVGHDYRHYFEATWFGIPILKVNEGYVDGKSFFEAPLIGSQADHPKLSQGANLALWTETSMFPAALVLDPRVTWQAVDADTSILNVPFEGETESIVVRFDPDTGLVTTMEVMRYRSTTDAKKTLWLPSSDEYATIDGVTMSVTGSATWFDQKYAWASFHTEDVVFNADFGDYLRARGE